jgi:hypothetical protein
MVSAMVFAAVATAILLGRQAPPSRARSGAAAALKASVRRSSDDSDSRIGTPGLRTIALPSQHAESPEMLKHGETAMGLFSSDEPKDDAIALLTEDHRKVQALFKQFESLKESEGKRDDKAALVQQICTELTLHALVEEEIFYPAVRKAIDDDDLMDEADVEHTSAKASSSSS